jgi:hypothetical protein
VELFSEADTEDTAKGNTVRTTTQAVETIRGTAPSSHAN